MKNKVVIEKNSFGWPMNVRVQGFILFISVFIFITGINLFFNISHGACAENKLYIRTIFDASEGAEYVMSLAQDEINRHLRDLGYVIITDKGYNYTIKVSTELRRDASDIGKSVLIFSAALSKPDSTKNLYSIAKTGSLDEVYKLCEDLVSDINNNYLNAQYREISHEQATQVQSEPEKIEETKLALLEKFKDLEQGKEIKIDEELLDALSKELYIRGDLDRELTEAEKSVIYRHPDEARRIIEITYYVKTKSKLVSHDNGNFPEDAYRHVLWSFLLAKEFGPELAKEVTDAHETGNEDNTPAERRMDFKNNEVGIRYASEGYTEESILQRILNDPEVILHPR